MNSLTDVYAMTWREFQLRLIAFNRMERNKSYLARQMTYFAGYGIHIPKAKKIDKFWEIEGEKPTQADLSKIAEIMERERQKIKNK